MQFNFISLGAFALLASVVAAGDGTGVSNGKRAVADNCKRSASVVPDTQLQTTAISPQPTIGAGVGGAGGKNGTTPTLLASGSKETGGTATSQSSGAGMIQVEWTVGVLAAAGVIAMAV